MDLKVFYTTIGDGRGRSFKGEKPFTPNALQGSLYEMESHDPSQTVYLANLASFSSWHEQHLHVNENGVLNTAQNGLA